MIATTAAVTDRLEFLDSLQRLLYDDDTKPHLLERDHLHQVLADGRTWVFGQEWSLLVSDRSLTKVLAAHLDLLGESPPTLEPVTDATGNAHRRVDLMLSGAKKEARQLSHLVVELKRPSVRIGQKEISQIHTYALAVAKDERFNTGNVKWEFWVVGNDLDEYAQQMSHQDDRTPGVVFDKHPVTVRAWRWADLLEENRQRLHFFSEHLDYESPDDETLQATLAKYLPAEAS